MPRSSRVSLAVIALLGAPVGAAPRASAPARSADRPAPAVTTQVELVTLTEQSALVVAVRAKPAELESALSAAFFKLFAVTQSTGLAIDGPPLARYLSRGTSDDPTLSVEAGFPVTGTPRGPLGDARVVRLPGGAAAVLEHRGRREQLGRAHHALDGWLAKQKRAAAGARWEVYLTTPITTPDPAAQRTKIVAPLATLPPQP